jgi:hypothetical protein
MVYIAAGIFALFCVAIIIYVIKIYREDKKTGPKKGYRIDDDDDLPYRR